MSSARKRRSCLAKRSSRSSSCGEPRAIMQLPSPQCPSTANLAVPAAASTTSPDVQERSWDRQGWGLGRSTSQPRGSGLVLVPRVSHMPGTIGQAKGTRQGWGQARKSVRGQRLDQWDPWLDTHRQGRDAQAVLQHRARREGSGLSWNVCPGLLGELGAGAGAPREAAQGHSGSQCPRGSGRIKGSPLREAGIKIFGKTACDPEKYSVPSWS